MEIEEVVEPLDPIDEAACNRILELFGTPYPQLTRPQILMLDRILEAAKTAQLPYTHVFQPQDVLYDGMMIKIPSEV